MLARRVSVRSLDAVRIMLWLCVLILIPCPMVVMVENSAYWDNFCKFNFVGVLAAWLLLPAVIEGIGDFAAASIRTVARIAMAALVSTSFMTVVVVAGQVVVEALTPGPAGALLASSREFMNAVTAKEALIDCVNRKVDHRSNILIVDSRVSAMFPVSPTSNKAGIDQYGFFTEYFGQFKVVPETTGRSVVNFYDYNFFYARDAEYEAAEAMDRVFRGDSAAMNRLNVSHVLCSSQTMPLYIVDWEKKGQVALEAASEAEGWRLYRNTSCRSAATDRACAAATALVPAANSLEPDHVP
jgi:hypothetical protein